MSMHIPIRPSPGPVQEPSRQESKARALGLTSATGLVIGSIVGTGVFAMPGVLAGAGTSSLLVLAVIAVGAMLLATLFGQFTRRVPNSDGGLYAYASTARSASRLAWPCSRSSASRSLRSPPSE